MLDGVVKTLYSPPPLLIRAPIFSKGFIVKTAHIVTNSRPIKGLVAFVRMSAMKSFGACTSALHQGLPASYQLDRAEDRMHPGEGCAASE